MGGEMITAEQLAAMGVRVKPLVWDEGGYMCTGADSIVGRFEISWGYVATRVYLQSPGNASWFPSVELAKAAADADHISRVCAAIELIGVGE